MTWYRWTRDGMVDETGKQILVLLPVNCTKRFLAMAGKEMVNKLNTIEQSKSLQLRRQIDRRILK